MIRDLIRDVLWARAHVLIQGGWRTRPAWRYIRMCARHEGIAIPPNLLDLIARGHYYRVWRDYSTRLAQKNAAG